jgi:hypothetical protein
MNLDFSQTHEYIDLVTVHLIFSFISILKFWMLFDYGDLCSILEVFWVVVVVVEVEDEMLLLL